MTRRQVSATTWPQRHNATFSELAIRIKESGLSSPTVLEVGPGAVTTWLRDRLPPGEGRDLSAFQNRYRAFLRNLDGLLRRFPTIPLCSYEPGELQGYLPVDSKMIVTDISPAVIEAVAREYADVEARVFDFATQTYPCPLDVIVCLCVLVRARAPEQIFANLYRSLNPGGLLVMDHRSCTTFNPSGLPLSQLAGQIWRKPPAATPVAAGS